MINTEQYRFAHGKSPRGRGNWAFEITWNRLAEVDGHLVRTIKTETVFAPSLLQYSAAKAWALRTFKAASVITLAS